MDRDIEAEKYDLIVSMIAKHLRPQIYWGLSYVLPLLGCLRAKIVLKEKVISLE